MTEASPSFQFLTTFTSGFSTVSLTLAWLATWTSLLSMLIPLRTTGKFRSGWFSSIVNLSWSGWITIFPCKKTRQAIIIPRSIEFCSEGPDAADDEADSNFIIADAEVVNANSECQNVFKWKPKIFNSDFVTHPFHSHSFLVHSYPSGLAFGWLLILPFVFLKV